MSQIRRSLCTPPDLFFYPGYLAEVHLLSSSFDVYPSSVLFLQLPGKHYSNGVSLSGRKPMDDAFSLTGADVILRIHLLIKVAGK